MKDQKMIKFGVSFLAAALFATGCTTITEPTAIPVNPNVQVAPQTQPTPVPLPSPSGCQSKILGKVTDASGALLKGATVEISGAALKQPSRTRTDENGLYGFAGLCAGNYAFTVTPAGKAGKKLPNTASVDGAGSARIDLTFK